MKRVMVFSMYILLMATSIIINLPICIYAADNDFTLSTDSGTNIPYSEAKNAVNNKGDIYNAKHELMFAYLPTDDYNWSYGDIHFSDAQVMAVLQSNNGFNKWLAIKRAQLSHSGLNRFLMGSLGFLVGGDSSLGTDLVDNLMSNYNYLNDMTYSETDGLTIGKDTVDSLKKKLERQYFESIGCYYYEISGTPQKAVDDIKARYEVEEDYVFDFNKAENFDFAFTVNYYGYLVDTAYAYNKSDYPYLYFADVDNYKQILNCVSDLSTTNCFSKVAYPLFQSTLDDDNSYKNISIIGSYQHGNIVTYCTRNENYFTDYSNANFFMKYDKSYDYNFKVYSKDGSMPFIFKSYEALYNYVHGSQTAYVSSKINEASEDLKLSIDDMNTDITDKLDEVIDSINSKKEGMTADELQNAIDKGLESLKKDTGDIKDNTSDIKEDTGNILDVLKQQNDILLQILGVTEYIAYNKGEDNNNYTIADVSNCFNTMFSSLQYAVLYGVNKTGQNEASTVSYAAYSVDTYSTEDLDYRNGLFGKFPFSVPYQLYEWLQVLQTDPVAPMFNYNYGFLIGHTNEQAYDITFDLKQFESWAAVGKSFLRLSFTLLFAIGIYKRFKGEV